MSRRARRHRRGAHARSSTKDPEQPTWDPVLATFTTAEQRRDRPVEVASSSQELRARLARRMEELARTSSEVSDTMAVSEASSSAVDERDEEREGDEEGEADPRGAAAAVEHRAASPSAQAAGMDGPDLLVEGSRVYGVTGWSKPGSHRRALRAARALEREHRRRAMAQSRAELAARRVEQKRAPYLPAGGEPGSMAGRSYRRLRLEAHRATSEVLAGAYPFLAEEGLGSSGLLVGQDAWSGAAFCFDPWELYRSGALTNPNLFLAGQIGRGKSTLAKSLAIRCMAFGRRVYVPGDPKGEWSAVARAVGGQVVKLAVGSAARLNPLDEGPRPSLSDDAAWRVQVRARRQGLLAALAESTLDRRLGATERSALDAALEVAERRCSAPVLPSVVEAMLDPEAAVPGSSLEQLRVDGREVAHGLARLVRGDLAGLFDGPSTVRFDPGAVMLSLDLSAISGSDTLIGLVMTCASTWMEAALSDPNGGQRLVVYDEAWRLLAQPALLSRMQAQWKLSRAWGLANLMVVHRLSDLEAVGASGSEARGLAQGLLGDTATRILYNEPYDEAQAAAKVLGLSAVEVAQLPELARGEGLWRVNERAFVVRHLCTPAELELFDTDERMVGR